MKKKSLTVLITTYNERNNIVPCIESAKLLTHDIIVIDTESTDDTLTIAKNAGVVVKTHPYSRIVEPVRQFSIDQAKGDWVLILDADERISQKLANEIIKVMNQDEETHFKIKRKNFFASRWLRHGAWWPDMMSGRLFMRSNFVSWDHAIHSKPVISGREGKLAEALVHYSQGNLEKMVEKTAVFEDIESDLLSVKAGPATVLTFFRKFLGEFYRRMLVGRGFLDGKYGVIAALYQCYSKTITYLFLYEKQNNRRL